MMIDRLSESLSPNAGAPKNAFVRAGLFNLAISLIMYFLLILGNKLNLISPSWLMLGIFPIVIWCRGCHYMLWKGIRHESAAMNALRISVSAIVGFISIGVSIGLIGGVLLGDVRSEKNNDLAKINNSANSTLPDIQVLVSRQSSDGVTENDFSQAFLKRLEQYSVERVREKIGGHYQSRGLPAPDIKIASEATYIEVSGRKLGVIRMSDETGNNAMVFGVSGNEMVRILCSTSTSYRVEVTSGKCADKLSEIFGVSFSQ
jgi:hypothetical protein